MKRLGNFILEARARVVIKRRLRLAGVQIPEAITFDLKALKELEAATERRTGGMRK